MGCWAEHEDGSLILVESVEGGTVVYSMFDVAQDPPVEFRDAMPEAGFKSRFSYPNVDDEEWTWHDKTPFAWDRIMADFPAGQRASSAAAQLSAAARVAASLDLRAGRVRGPQRPAREIMQRLRDALDEALSE